MQKKSAILEQSQRFGSFLLWAATSIAAKLIIMAVAVAFGGWLLYAHGWQPLREEVHLPAGILPSNPAIDTSLLQGINSSRAARTNYEGKNFTVFIELFESL